MLTNTKFNDKKALLITGLFLLLLNLIQASFTPLIDDEAYYWMWSQNLDFGYFDHPPMIAYWISLGFGFFQNELGLRLVSVLMGSIGYVLLGNLLNIQSRKEYLLYTLVYLSCTLFNVFSFIATPDSPLLFFCILYFFLLKRFLDSFSLYNAILLGIVTALLLYSKYHGILVIGFSLLPLLPKLYKKKVFYIVIVTAFLVYLPHIIWQINNDWVSLRYHLLDRNNTTHFSWTFVSDYLLIWLWAGWPLLFWFIFESLIKFKYDKAFKRSLLSTIIGVFLFFLIFSFRTYIQGQWILIALVPLLIIAFDYLKHKTKNSRLLKNLALLSILLLIGGRIYFMLPDVAYKTNYHGWEDFMKNAGEITHGTAVFEKYQYTSLFNFYNYPSKVAQNYVTIENRKSQFDLWNSEDKIDKQPITYFSKYITSSDSLQIDNRKKDWFKYRYIDEFQTTKNLTFDVEIIQQINKSYTLKIEVQNHSNKAFNSEKGNFKMKMAIADHKHAESFFCFVQPTYDSFEVEPHQSISIEAKVELCDLPKREYLAYIGLVNEDLPLKIQSNHISLKVD